MTDTKTITFEGRSYTVPVWVEWAARDSDHKRWGYSDKPICGAGGVFNRNKNDTKVVLLVEDNPIYWRDSLTKV